MTNKQQTVVASQASRATKDGLPIKQTGQPRWVQDTLEDDEVREALKFLQSRGKDPGESSAQS